MGLVGKTALGLALLLFLLFFANVLAGALGWGERLGDVPQMIVLFAAAVAFVVGILVKEAEAGARRR